MTREIWINLPVKNVQRSVAFFTQLGFQFNTEHSNDQSAAMIVGAKQTVIMLFEEKLFEQFTQHALGNTQTGTEVLLSFDAESREAVDALIKRVMEAGGTIFGQPSEIPGGMYGCGFCDLDGHRWNMLYMGPRKS